MASVVEGEDGGSSYSCGSASSGAARMMGMDDDPSPGKARVGGRDEDEPVSGGGTRVTDQDSSSSSGAHRPLDRSASMTKTIESLGNLTTVSPNHGRGSSATFKTGEAMAVERDEDRGGGSCAGSMEVTKDQEADSEIMTEARLKAEDATIGVGQPKKNLRIRSSANGRKPSSIMPSIITDDDGGHHPDSATRTRTRTRTRTSAIDPAHPLSASCSSSSSSSSASSCSCSSSSSSSYSYSIHQALRPSTRTNPIPTLRHSSASLSKLLQLSSSSSSPSSPSPSHPPHPTITNHPSHTSPTLTLIQRYLHPPPPPTARSHPHTPVAAHPRAPTPPPNSIKFPSSSPTTCLSLCSDDRPPASDPQRLLDHHLKRWLTTRFEPDLISSHNTSSYQSLIPELDLLVGFKSITDQLNLPQLDRQQAWAALRHVYPFVRSWARPTQPGLRSNQEFVVIGIRLKRTHTDDAHRPHPPSSSDHLIRSDSTPSSSPYESNEHRWSLPFDKLDFHKPIPTVVQSSELVEFMRRRICELEGQSGALTSQAQSSSRRKISIPNTPAKSKQRLKRKRPYIAHRLFRLDSHHNSSYRAGKNIAHVLGERIWCSLIQACKMTKYEFRDGERLTASWVERMNKFEFDVICKRCKSSHTQTIETATQKIIKLIHPFHKHNRVKLFKYQPVAHFNSIVFNRREDLDGPSGPSKPNDFKNYSSAAVPLKDFQVIQIDEHSESNQRQQQKGKNTQGLFGSLSTRSITMNLLSPSKNEDDRKPQSSPRTLRKQRGKSLDLSTLLISSPKQPLKVPNPKGTKSIGGVLEQLNNNIHQKRKSLNLDKLFTQQQHSIQSSFDLMSHPTDEVQDPGQSVIRVEEIMIEFNLLSLNQLKIQIKLLKMEP